MNHEIESFKKGTGDDPDVLATEQLSPVGTECPPKFTSSMELMKTEIFCVDLGFHK